MATDQYVVHDYIGAKVEIEGERPGSTVRVGRYNSIMRGPVVAVHAYDSDDGSTSQVWLNRAAAIKLATALLDTALECEAHQSAFEGERRPCAECGTLRDEDGYCTDCGCSRCGKLAADV